MGTYSLRIIMFVVKIFNMETEEEFTEIARDHKELDDLVESMHNVYGDILQIEISQDEDEILTKRQSEKPEPFSLEESQDVSVESLPSWLSQDLTGHDSYDKRKR